MNYFTVVSGRELLRFMSCGMFRAFGGFNFLPGLVIGIEFIGLYPHGNCDVANLSVKTKIETSELLRTAVAENSSDFYPVSFRAVCGF